MCQDCPPEVQAMTEDEFANFISQIGKPEEDIQEDSDEVIARLLSFLNHARDSVGSKGVRDNANEALVENILAEFMAGKLMYKVNPSSIAYSLALIVQRYDKVLTMFTDMAVGQSSLTGTSKSTFYNELSQRIGFRSKRGAPKVRKSTPPDVGGMYL